MFSWLTGPSQLMFGSVRLFALSSFMSIALGVPVEYLVIICGLVVLAYTVLGGYWAVCFTDMFQFMFLFPIACVLMVLSLANVGGFNNFVAHAPVGYFNPFAGEYGWLFLIVYTISQTTGYNNFGNAQRYFCADTEQSAKRIAVLCMILFTIGSVDLLSASTDRARRVTRSGHSCKWFEAAFRSGVHRDGTACVAARHDRCAAGGDAGVVDGFFVRSQPHHHRHLCEGHLSGLSAQGCF